MTCWPRSSWMSRAMRRRSASCSVSTRRTSSMCSRRASSRAASSRRRSVTSTMATKNSTRAPLDVSRPTGQLQRPVALDGVDVHLFAARRLVGPMRGGAEVAEETATVRRHDRGQERRADQRRARLAEQRRAGQVDLADDAGAVERAVAVRRAVVQLDVAVARLLELVQRLDELLVLRPQLLLVDLEVVTEQRALVVGGRGNRCGARAAARTQPRDHSSCGVATIST